MTETKADSPKGDGQYYSRARVRKSFVHYIFGRGVQSIATIAVVFLVVRYLDVEEYAGFVALTGLSALLRMLSNAGMERILPRYLPVLREAGHERELTRLVSRLMLIRVILTSAVIAPVLVAQDFFREQFSIPGDPYTIYAFAAYTLLFSLSMYQRRTLQALLRQREATTGLSIEWFSKLATLALLIVLAGGISLFDVMWVHAATSALGSLYMYICFRRHMRGRPLAAEVQPQLVSYRDVFRTGWDNHWQMLIGISTAPGVNRLLCAYFLPSVATAAFGFAANATAFLNRYAPAPLLLGLVEPSLMARYGQEKDFTQLARGGSALVKLNLFFLAPLAVWLAVAAGPIVGLLTGGKYVEYTWVMAVILVGIIIESNRTVLQLFANAVDRSGILVQSAALCSLFLPIQVAAIVWIGLPGLLAAMMVLGLFRNVYITVKLRAAGYSYTPDFRALAQISFLAGASGMLGLLAMHAVGGGVIGAGLAAIVTGGLFYLVSFFWKVFKREERNMLNRFIGKKIFVW